MNQPILRKDPNNSLDIATFFRKSHECAMGNKGGYRHF